MTNAITFDTHEFIKQLIEAGFTESQAEALSKAQVNFLNDNLATKQDIFNLKQDIFNLKQDLELKIAHLKADLLKWMIGALIAQSGIIIGFLSIILNT